MYIYISLESIPSEKYSLKNTQQEISLNDLKGMLHSIHQEIFF